LNNLKFNRSAEKPFHLFEVADVILYDNTAETLSKRDLHLACLVHSDTADYTQIKSLLDHYFRTLGVINDISFKTEDHPSFIEGRTAGIYFQAKRIGYIGEIYPQVVINYGLDYPTAAFEIDLIPFMKFLNIQ
jgi:phenylalanyl-tRNA synthetase beta chain